MANSITGCVIAVSQLQTVPSAQAGKEPIKKRQLYMDCTRFDPYTGERSKYENKPLLEFSGDKVIAKVNPVLEQLKQGDVVTVSFDIQGMDYQDKTTGKKKNFTGIRCYDIRIERTADGRTVAAPQPAPAAQVPAQSSEPAPAAASPFVNDQQGQKNDDELPF